MRRLNEVSATIMAAIRYEIPSAGIHRTVAADALDLTKAIAPVVWRFQDRGETR